MIKVRIRKENKVIFESPKIGCLGLKIEYSNKKYVEFDADDLIGANLIGANLIGANLIDANLEDANLIGANLIDANLRGAKLDEKEEIRKGKILKEKTIVYKKCQGIIVTFELPVGAIVFSINNHKCRTNKAKVVAIGDDDTLSVIRSEYDSDFIYEVGKEVEVEDFDLAYNVECSTGIHFFFSRKDAEEY